MSDAMYDLIATQQTADLIMVEVGASCPCSINHIKHWLREQCTFDDVYMADAIDQLVEQGKIDVDEDGIVDYPQDAALIRLRKKLEQPETMAVFKRLAMR